MKLTILTDNKQTKETINFLKQQNIEQVFSSHCNDLPALMVFLNEFKINQVKTGIILEL